MPPGSWSLPPPAAARKKEALLALLGRTPFYQCIVFCNEMAIGEDIAFALRANGFPARFICGKQEQVWRVWRQGTLHSVTRTTKFDCPEMRCTLVNTLKCVQGFVQNRDDISNLLLVYFYIKSASRAVDHSRYHVHLLRQHERARWQTSPASPSASSCPPT